MGVNKVVYGDETLIDLTDDTVTADDLDEGATAHDASGEKITGTFKTAELKDIRIATDEIEYSSAGDAVRSQVAMLRDDIRVIENAPSNIIINEHFYPIFAGNLYPVERWIVNNESIEAYNPVSGSDYIKCPKYLYLDFKDASSRCYLYFYKLINGEYIVNWDIIDFTSGANIKNYLRQELIPSNVIHIPDNDMYMKISVFAGAVNFWGWDGAASDFPICSDVSIPATNQSDYEYTFSSDGSVGFVIPGSSLCVATAPDTPFSTVLGITKNEISVINTAALNFFSLSEGYDYFWVRISIEQNACITGNISNAVTAFIPNKKYALPTANADVVLKNCKKINSLNWTIMSEIPAYLFNEVENGVVTSTTKGAAYKAGVKYNGLPYCSNWDIAHYVGWHASPHTFLNAVNDPDSIFYKERVLSWDKKQESVYYGTVCSAFGSMAQGWDYPQTNAGFVYDPDINVREEKTPPIGSLYSNLINHCVIPQKIYELDNNIKLINAYEGIHPLSIETTRYSNIDIDSDISGFNSYYGKGYYDNYGYAVSYKKANGNVPYADFDDIDIVGGSARPYKGDKSVYTNNEPVLINIKSGTTLTLTKDGESQTIDVTELTQIDVTEYLDGDGIYYVSTDADENDIEESFEYHEVEPITYDIKNGRILFGSSDFWYASCYLEGFPLFTDADGNLQAKVCCVPSREDNDYRDWMKEGYFTSATVAFRKGEYGAYVVPLELGEVEDIIPDDSTGGTYDYDLLYNKPKINGVTLEGDISSDALGIVSSGGIGTNLLHNADWAYSLVNQREHSGEVSDAYCIDRWIGNGTVTPVAGQYVTLAKNTTMTQRMEIVPESLVGKTCTFSIDVDGTVQTATMRFPTAAGNAPNTASVLSGTVEFGFVSGSFKLCDVDCAAVPYVKFTAAADINVRRVFLELGEVSHMVGTAMGDFGENLMVCQRYDTDLSTGGGIIVGMGMSVTSEMARILCSLPTSMRVRPSLEIEDLSGLMLRISGVNPAPSAISVFGNSSDTFITFNVTVSDNIESNQPCALINNAGAKIRLSARL